MRVLEELDDPAWVERLENENIQELKVNFRELLKAYEYQQEVKAARKGQASASDSETEDTRQGPGPSNQFNSEPDNPTLTSEGIGRKNIFSDIFSPTPNLSARDNINPLFGELNPSPVARTAGGEQELDPAGSAARSKEGWDPNPVSSEGPDWNSTPSWREGGTPEGNSTPRETLGGITGNTPRGLPTPAAVPDPVVIPDLTAAPTPVPGTIPAVPLPPFRIPPVNPASSVPPPSVPTAPTRGPSTVPVNPFVNLWAPPPRVPAQGGAQPSVVPRRPVSGSSYLTASGTAVVPPIPAFVPIPGPIMDLRLRVVYPIFKGKRHEDPDLHIASFEQTMNINGENSVHKARLFPTTLKQNAFAWYCQLDPQTQSDWDDVKNEFLEQFRVAQKDPDIMYQIQNMKQQEKETIKEFLTRFRLMIRKLEVPPTDAQKITWLRNAVHQRFITSVEDRGYANADDFEDKLKTCAYSMAYRDGAFSNERDAYRRSDQDSEDEHSDDNTGTRKKKRYLREQRTEQKLVNHWKKALSSIGKERAKQSSPAPVRYCHICNNNSHDTRVCYFNTKNSQSRRKDVPVHAIEGVKETLAREEPRRNYPRRNYGEGISQPQTGQLECYYCYEKGRIKRNCPLFKKHMDERRTSKTPHVAGSNAIYVELKGNESVSVMTREMRRQAPEPEATPGSEPDDEITPLRRWDKEDKVTKDTINFIQEMQTSDEQEDVEVGDERDYFPFSNMETPDEDPNPQKAEITMQELFNLAPYCKELMLRRLMVIPKTTSEGITPEGALPDEALPDASRPLSQHEKVYHLT
ncbi:hypothetical protein R1sor_014014 [Riccia sorocarpa]|uniref:Retrotransposon gag domain-containing protein n=1 Tax=Riccia sorocarpa TaxID=122646 RepID=A0ABD3H873_9MARC